MQATNAKKLFNPVVCLTEGDSVFFNVDSKLKRYPVYKKDSTLNTNPDFDYGDFETLADMINRQNITVTSFSFIFKDQGIFVFENSVSETLTIISVVGASQTCKNAEGGVGASMVTKESLAEIGIKAYNKTVQPKWWFIIMVILAINSIAYIVIGFAQWAYNINMNEGRLSSKDQTSNTIYYDKLRNYDDEKREQGIVHICCACLTSRKKKENKVEAVEPEEKHDFAVSYKDMEALLAELHSC